MTCPQSDYSDKLLSLSGYPSLGEFSVITDDKQKEDHCSNGIAPQSYFPEVNLAIQTMSTSNSCQSSRAETTGPPHDSLNDGSITIPQINNGIAPQYGFSEYPVIQTTPTSNSCQSPRAETTGPLHDSLNDGSTTIPQINNGIAPQCDSEYPVIQTTPTSNSCQSPRADIKQTTDLLYNSLDDGSIKTPPINSNTQAVQDPNPCQPSHIYTNQNVPLQNNFPKYSPIGTPRNNPSILLQFTCPNVEKQSGIINRYEFARNISRNFSINYATQRQPTCAVVLQQSANPLDDYDISQSGIFQTNPAYLVCTMPPQCNTVVHQLQGYQITDTPSNIRKSLSRNLAYPVKGRLHTTSGKKITKKRRNGRVESGTACGECRDAKRKCDGEETCQRCCRNNLQCVRNRGQILPIIYA